MKAFNIVWDLEDDVFEYNIDDCDLPRVVEIPLVVNEDEIADYLSDKYGFCVARYSLGKDFEELTPNELWELRTEIILNSLYVADYTNSFGFSAKDVSYFFEGYIEYIYELMNEDNADDSQFKDYDNLNNLWAWFNCYDDLSWLKFEGEE